MFQIVEGIFKVRTGNVVGIADGKGMFLWLPKAEIKGSHPMTYDKWQTTRFAISQEYKVNWKPEKNWDEWKHTYNPTNIIPIPTPIPAEFVIEPQLQPQYANPQNMTNVYTPPFQAAETRSHALPTQTAALPSVGQDYTPRKISPVVGKQQSNYASHNEHVLSTLRVISDNIYKILQLFQKFMAPPTMQTADTLISHQQMTQEQVYDEYGVPPDDDHDELPSIL